MMSVISTFLLVLVQDVSSRSSVRTGGSVKPISVSIPSRAGTGSEAMENKYLQITSLCVFLNIYSTGQKFGHTYPFIGFSLFSLFSTL